MILQTDRLYLRKFVEEDAKRMSEYRSKKEVAKFQSWQSYSEGRAKRRIKHLLKIKEFYKPGVDYHFAIVLKENDEIIGDIFIDVLNVHTFVIGYTLDSFYWSLGYASEMVSAFIEYMHINYHFEKVMAYAYKDNMRSRKLLERLGFLLFQSSKYYDDVGYIKLLDK